MTKQKDSSLYTPLFLTHQAAFSAGESFLYPVPRYDFELIESFCTCVFLSFHSCRFSNHYCILNVGFHAAGIRVMSIIWMRIYIFILPSFSSILYIVFRYLFSSFSFRPFVP